MNPTRRDALKLIAAGILAPAIPVTKPVNPWQAIFRRVLAKSRKYEKALGIPEAVKRAFDEEFGEDRIQVSGAGPTLRADYLEDFDFFRPPTEGRHQ